MTRKMHKSQRRIKTSEESATPGQGNGEHQDNDYPATRYPIDYSPEPVSESPAPEPLHCGLNDPSHPDASNEPVLNIDNIQGNILNGFMKDNQAFLFLTLAPDSANITAFKRWLAALRPFLATSAEVIAF